MISCFIYLSPRQLQETIVDTIFLTILLYHAQPVYWLSSDEWTPRY